MCFKIILLCFTWGIFVTSYFQNAIQFPELQISVRRSITGKLWSIFVFLRVKWYLTSGPFYSAGSAISPCSQDSGECGSPPAPSDMREVYCRLVYITSSLNRAAGSGIANHSKHGSHWDWHDRQASFQGLRSCQYRQRPLPSFKM
jgi:hypothetical protein